MTTAARIATIAALLHAATTHAAGAQSACPARFKTLVERSDLAFASLDAGQRTADARARCRSATALVAAEEQLMHFLQEHQVGCEIDIARIEQQQRRLQQSIGWKRDAAIGCGH